MKLAIISDIHFPLEISRGTILYSRCRYEDSFYFALEEDINRLNPDEIDVLIICGDFCWDYIYFQNLAEWNFNLPLQKIQELRTLLDQNIPIIFIEGNHDIWFNSYIYSEGSKIIFNKDKFKEVLIKTYRLDDRMIQKTMDQLEMVGEDDFVIGENIYFLRNDGLFIDDIFIYGLPYYDKDIMRSGFSNFKEKMIHDYNKCVESKIESLKSNKLPIKTIIIQHVHPPEPKFIQAFKIPACDIKTFYWGHKHIVSQDFIEKLKKYGPYQCVMPEKNDLKLQIYEI